MNNETPYIKPEKVDFKDVITDVNCRYGAPMGRTNIRNPNLIEISTHWYLRHVPLVYDGAYDQGGAYWGCGTPLYVAYTHVHEVHGEDEYNDYYAEIYIRADDREEAKKLLLEDYPHAKFFN